MAEVYLKKICSNSDSKEISKLVAEIFEKLNSNYKFKGKIPLKVHFGEKGCTTFIKPENYSGIIGEGVPSILYVWI